jgi:SAM-dependent methyltransferase
MEASPMGGLKAIDAAAAVSQFEAAMGSIAPFMLPSLKRQRDTFGDEWVQQFGTTLSRLVATSDERLTSAVRGYVNFALDGMRLQKKFEKKLEYENKSYLDASNAVYQNKDYMFGMYLPGILLSHYLWPHHYRQFQFYQRSFLPSFASAPVAEFCDIGPGTGFYSRQLLTASPRAEGWAFDMSPSSLEYSATQLAAFGVAGRWHEEIRDIVLDTPARQWPFLVCIEVLEHLEDPLAFLKALRKMLMPGGRGLISAAVTAPNEDHIYLYNSGFEVRTQIEEAGFVVLDSQEDRAYTPKGSEPVPINAAFVVS